VVKNLKTQNGLLKEENELLRINETECFEKDQMTKEEFRKVEKFYDGEMQKLRHRHMEEVKR
jgi:hypothetical protein